MQESPKMAVVMLGSPMPTVTTTHLVEAPQTIQLMVATAMMKEHPRETRRMTVMTAARATLDDPPDGGDGDGGEKSGLARSPPAKRHRVHRALGEKGGIVVVAPIPRNFLTPHSYTSVPLATEANEPNFIFPNPRSTSPNADRCYLH